MTTNKLKSLRLNKGIRADILSNIMEAYSIENPAPVVNDNRGNNLEEVLLTWYKEFNADVIATYSTASDELKAFFKTSNYFYYAGGGSRYNTVYFSGNNSDDDMEDKDKVYLPRSRDTFVNLDNPDTDIPDYVQAVLDANSKQAKIIRKERNVLSAYESEYDRYKQDIEQVLSSVNTTGQLTELWPEVEKFLPKGMSNPKMISLPAVNIALLNRKLGE